MIRKKQKAFEFESNECILDFGLLLIAAWEIFFDRIIKDGIYEFVFGVRKLV